MLRLSLALLSGVVALTLSAGGAATTAGFPARNGTILAGLWKGKLYVVSTQGRRPREIRGVLTNPYGREAAWSPDGIRIAFGRRGGGIAITDATARHRRRLTSKGGEPAWSPDGSRLVFSQDGWLYFVNASGRGIQRLFRGWDARWSPDGRRLAFTVSGNGGSDIYVAALDGSERVRLAAASSFDCNGLPGSTSFAAPAWAPDGSRIAYESWQACGTNAYGSISAASPDGARHWNLVDDAGSPGGPSAPAWSPDGSALAYVDFYDSGPSGLKVRRLGGPARTIASSRWVPFDWRPVCGLRGRPRGDKLSGSASADLICGLGGGDTITGGGGSDRLFGETGNDRFFTRDGEFDVVGCGAGRDTVVADAIDLVGRDCELVDRS